MIDQLKLIPLHHAAEALPITYDALLKHVQRANLPVVRKGHRIYAPRGLVKTIRTMMDGGHSLAQSIKQIDANANRIGQRAGDRRE